MILIFYAFSREVGPLKRRLKGRRPLSEPGLRGFEYKNGEQRIVFVATGIGTERARKTARTALDRFPQAQLVMGTGVAGALAPELAPGDIVLADRIIAGPASGPAALQAPFTAPAKVLEHCESVLQSAGLPFSRGALLTSSGVLATTSAKRLAGEQSGAIAVDMESAAIAEEADLRRLPFVAVRTVMDSLEDEVFGAEIADESGQVRPLAATAYLARNPSAIAQLPRMMRNLSRATRSIADAIEALGLAVPPRR